MPAAPSPHHVVRNNGGQIGTVSFSSDNERLYSGDTLGNVTMISTRTLRPLAAWPAHTDSILAVREADQEIITHGRDNKLHVWLVPSPPADATVGDTAATMPLPTPTLLRSHDVNALNFCAFSLLLRRDSSSPALIALPNLVDSNTADIWFFESFDRLHGAIGKPQEEDQWEIDETKPRGERGIVMCMHLYRDGGELRLLAGYESGNLILWRSTVDTPTVNGRGWEALSSWKLHNESIMGLSVSNNNTFALTVSADHLIGFHPLTADQGEATTHPTKHAGNAAVAIRPDHRVCAIGGWDGKIRLYSTKTFKPLGTLSYHREGCSALAFAHLDPQNVHKDEDEDDPLALTADELNARAHWLAAGSKDSRVSIWVLRELGAMTTQK